MTKEQRERVRLIVRMQPVTNDEDAAALSGVIRLLSDEAEADRKLGQAVRESLDHCFTRGDRSVMLDEIADALRGDDIYHAADIASDVTPLLDAIARALREEAGR